jgi:NADPH oxidase
MLIRDQQSVHVKFTMTTETENYDFNEIISSYNDTMKAAKPLSFWQRMSKSTHTVLTRFARRFNHREGFLLLFWILAQTLIFVSYFIYYSTSRTFAGAYESIGIGFCISRASAGVLNIDFGLILFTVSLRFLNLISKWKRLRDILFIDKHKAVHIVIGKSIALFSLIHCVAHAFNYVRVSKKLLANFVNLWLLTPTGLTGNLLILFLILITLTSLQSFRNKFYHWFFGIHRLYILVLIAVIIHGSFCFLGSNFYGDQCKLLNGSKFVFHLLPALVIFLIDKAIMIKELWIPVEVISVTEKASNVMEIRFRKKSWLTRDIYQYKPGQYLNLYCPDISWFQKHPFSITSQQTDEYISVDIMCRGHWTKTLKQYFVNASISCETARKYKFVNLGLENFMPKLYVDGPFQAPADRALDYDVCVMIGCGVGISPFVSNLKAFCYGIRSMPHYSGKKIYFLHVSSSEENFGWFHDTLTELEEIDVHHSIDVSLYWTMKNKNKITPSFCREVTFNMLEGVDAITRLKRAETFFGRPNWDNVFARIERQNSGKKVGVFYCGNHALGDTLKVLTRSRNGPVQYQFHEEIF